MQSESALCDLARNSASDERDAALTDTANFTDALEAWVEHVVGPFFFGYARSESVSRAVNERFWNLAALRKDSSKAESGEDAARVGTVSPGSGESVLKSRCYSLDVVALVVDHALAVPCHSREGAPAGKEGFPVRPLNGFFECAFCLSERVAESKNDGPLGVAGNRSDDLLAKGRFYGRQAEEGRRLVVLDDLLERGEARRRGVCFAEVHLVRWKAVASVVSDQTL